ncbi:S-layer-like y domain-containing protein, partial [Dysosmobacter welbionis]
VPAAVAAVLDGAPLQDLQVEIRQSVPQHSLRVRIIPQKSRHRPCGHQAALHLGDDILAGAGQQLDQIPAGGQHALVPVYQHPQAASRGDLFGLHEIGRQVLCDFAAQQAHAAHIGLLHVQVPDHRQRTLMAHSGPHIQLAVGPQRQVHDRIVHRSPDVALVIGHRQQRSQRASALDLQRHAGPVLLQGVAHHGDRSQRPAQRRRGHR